MAYREVFWNITYGELVYLFAAVSVAIWGYALYQRVKLWRQGKPDDRTKDLGKRISAFFRTGVTDILGHQRFLRDPYSGIMHFIIFWGFLILFAAAGIDAVTHYVTGPLLGLPLEGAVYLWFSLIVDLGGVMVLAGVAMAAYRRYVMKPAKLNSLLDDGIGLALLAGILVSGFVVEGLRIAATEAIQHPEWAVWSPGGYVFAKLFSGLSQDTLLTTHRAVWWFHMLLSFGTLLYAALAFSKLQHIVVSPLNVFFRNLGPIGVPAPIDIEKAETEPLGVANIKDFTWKQLLDLDACNNCGRCQDMCPAYATGKPLSPRKLVQDLKGHMIKAASAQVVETESGPTLIGEGPSEDQIWACTTCAACQDTCPVYVEHVVKIIDLRRNLVLAQEKMPESAQVMLRNMQSRGHPWAGIQSLRLRGDWTSGLDLKILGEVESANTLFWVGCTGALAERNVQATLAMTRVLKAAGVDFAVMGEAETCCGDPARRAGYEFQFQIMAEQNIEAFKTYGVKEIITACPHCYNTLKNEYPKYGGEFKVVHYTQLLAELISQGKLKLSCDVSSKLTYQDPCYLGRYNSVYAEPRQILQAIPKAGLTEMERSRNTSFCCGGGGGHMWIEEQSGTTKISHKRIEDVVKTGADTVVTACPFCLQMMEEGIEHKNIKDSLKAKDIIEVVEAAMTQAQPFWRE